MHQGEKWPSKFPIVWDWVRLDDDKRQIMAQADKVHGLNNIMPEHENPVGAALDGWLLGCFREFDCIAMVLFEFADMPGQWAYLHVANLEPGRLRGTRELAAIIETVLDKLDGLLAYIPATKPGVARLARSMGFNLELIGDYYYGRIEAKQASTTTTTSCTSN